MKKDKLKTLKDIFDKRTGVVSLQEQEIGMNVVKDCRVIMGYDKLLKQEAIKWIKEFEENNATDLIAWVKHFFNLTDEEIAEEKEQSK